MQAALWKIPSEFDSSMSDESSVNAKDLELLCRLDNADYGDAKW